MLATQEAQVIPTMQMKHFCTLISLPEVGCDPVPLLTPVLLGGCKSERSGGPELRMLFAGSAKKEEQSQWQHGQEQKDA